MTARSAVICHDRTDLVVISTTDARTVVGYRANYQRPTLTGRAVDVTRAAGRFDPYGVFYLEHGPTGMAPAKLAKLRRDVYAALPRVTA